LAVLFVASIAYPRRHSGHKQLSKFSFRCFNTSSESVYCWHQQPSASLVHAKASPHLEHFFSLGILQWYSYW